MTDYQERTIGDAEEAEAILRCNKRWLEYEKEQKAKAGKKEEAPLATGTKSHHEADPAPDDREYK